MEKKPTNPGYKGQLLAHKMKKLRIDDEEELDGSAAMKMEGGGREHWLPPLSWAAQLLAK